MLTKYSNRDSTPTVICRVVTTVVLCAAVICGVLWCLTPQIEDYRSSTERICAVLSTRDHNSSCLTHTYRGHIFTADVVVLPSSSSSSSFSEAESSSLVKDASLEYCMVPPFTDSMVPCWVNEKARRIYSVVPPFPWCVIALLFLSVSLFVLALSMTIRSFVLRNCSGEAQEPKNNVNTHPVDYGTL